MPHAIRRRSECRMVHLQIAELTPSYRAPRYHTRVIPVIAYAGANDEYRKALEDYRKDDFDNCLVKMRQCL